MFIAFQWGYAVMLTNGMKLGLSVAILLNLIKKEL